MNKRLQILLIVVSAILLITCSCPISDLFGESRGEISDERRFEVLNDIAAFHAELPEDGDPEEGVQKLLDHLNSIPEMVAAGVAEDGSVWGQFTDGRLAVFVEANPLPQIDDTDTQNAPTPSINHPMQNDPYLHALWTNQDNQNWSTNKYQNETINLPLSSDAVVVNALSARYGGEWNQISSLLNEGMYNVRSIEATVENLKTIQNVGVLYFSTHGAFGILSSDLLFDIFSEDEGSPDERIFVLKTSTQVSFDTERIYNEELAAGRLVYINLVEKAGLGIAGIRTESGELITKETEESRTPLEWSYGITQAFVRMYFSFSPHSFVFVSACNSFKYDSMDAFLEKGAAVYAGWTGTVYKTIATRTPDLVFSLLLGVEGINSFDPPHRPFDHLHIWEYIQQTGEDTDTTDSPPAKLMFAGDERIILAPSIQMIDVDEENDEITLHGIFGEDEGEVLINQTSIDVKEWRSDRIVTELPPADDPDGSGEVMVSVRNHDSNKVPLTLWQGSFNYTVEPDRVWADGLEQIAEMDLYIRADVHPYREKPGEIPQHRSVLVSTAQESSGTWSFEGSGTPDVCELAELSGGGELPAYDPEQSEDIATFFGAWGSVDGQTRTMDLDFSVSVSVFAGGELTITCDGVEQSQGVSLLVLDFIIQPVQLSLDGNFNIQEGQINGSTTMGMDTGATGTLEWDLIEADYPPDEDTHADRPTHITQISY